MAIVKMTDALILYREFIDLVGATGGSTKEGLFSGIKTAFLPEYYYSKLHVYSARLVSNFLGTKPVEQ